MKCVNKASFVGVLVIAAAGWAIGCSDSESSSAQVDAGADGTADTALDSVADTDQVDVNVDVEQDATPDVVPDTEPDVELDTEPDVLEPEVKFTEKVSECGGFASPEERPEDYCVSEKLIKSYDNATKVVSLTHARAHRNTCGDRSLEATFDAATKTLTVIETDAPRDSGRCRGTCVMDYLVMIENLTGEITLEWKQNVVDVETSPGVPKPTEIADMTIELPGTEKPEVVIISEGLLSGVDCTPPGDP